MTHSQSLIPAATAETSATDKLKLAQTLATQLTITPDKWHQLKANRKARALEQTAVALVFLLKNQPDQALQHLQQATGWLDRSISAPPCPDHGH
jgi:hypothetical protein